MVVKEMAPSEGLVTFHVGYAPETREMVVAAGGSEVLRQRVGGLVTAPVQIGER